MTSEDPGGKLPRTAPKQLRRGGRIDAEELHRSAAGVDTERLRGYARGGKPRVGEPVVVGEKGPEVFVADRPGRVIPNHRLPPRMRHGGRVEAFAGKETRAEEEAEGHELRRIAAEEEREARRLPRMARGGRIDEDEEGYGSPEPMQTRRLLASGAAGGDMPFQRNKMSSLPGASEGTARPGGRPEPRSTPTTRGKLATFGALKGIKRGHSPHTNPRGNPPAHDRPNTRPIGHQANPRGNPVGVGPARSPRSPSAPRQI